MKKWQMILFYIGQFTWGLVLNLVGLLVALGMLITGHRPYYCAPYIYFRTKWNFGGLELGVFFIIGDRCDGCALHEMGHAFQNLMFGPFTPLVVNLPSAYRYWLREMDTMKEKTIYTWLVLVLGAIVGIIPTICGFVFGLNWLGIIGVVVVLYITALSIWGIAFELPKYEHGYPLYDSIWIEGYATKTGNALFHGVWWEHVANRDKN